MGTVKYFVTGIHLRRSVVADATRTFPFWFNFPASATSSGSPRDQDDEETLSNLRFQSHQRLIDRIRYTSCRNHNVPVLAGGSREAESHIGLNKDFSRSPGLDFKILRKPLLPFPLRKCLRDQKNGFLVPELFRLLIRLLDMILIIWLVIQLPLTPYSQGLGEGIVREINLLSSLYSFVNVVYIHHLKLSDLTHTKQTCFTGFIRLNPYPLKAVNLLKDSLPSSTTPGLRLLLVIMSVIALFS